MFHSSICRKKNQVAGSDWISNIHTDIQKEIQRRCIDKGEQFAESSVPMEKFVVQVSRETLMNNNTLIEGDNTLISMRR